MSPPVKLNRIRTLAFAIMILLSYIYRRNGVVHKRLLYVGTILVLGPVLDRVASALGIIEELGFQLFLNGTYNLFFITLFVYDWLTLKRIHLISWGGWILLFGPRIWMEFFS